MDLTEEKEVVGARVGVMYVKNHIIVRYPDTLLKMTVPSGRLFIFKRPPSDCVRNIVFFFTLCFTFHSQGVFACLPLPCEQRLGSVAFF